MKAIKHFQTITKHKILVMQECFREVCIGRDFFMICLNMDGRNFESDAGIIREQEVRIMQNGKTKGILLHGFITKEEISIIMNTGLIMILTEKGNW